ncbi:MULTISPECIES: SDR family NAD(P)-dependent oxidoreductase [Sphingomonas]|jgi:NAD(P)-dependent dehydrogenase (short-subunit alcohol dehydrogenase family)|uniref:SDR family NAD(P)-dependent oxidoreductase n=1 Tax=Sphingomonas echinoides TaxID=59803 RepID=A0ABU4PGD9_9SPHN|nr:SDR family NAD(P)-dependent oxidoreductase [Sphingomonas echinoides]MDX5983283.1 SDR family NAD(P)-dependent oxidoreductase [Sphingomonas echinoides]
MSLQDRVAIVTGAGGGLGREHARYLARHGARVVVNDVSIEAAESVAAAIVAEGGDAIGIGASVTEPDAVAAMAETVMQRWGRIDILINNAGILRDKSFTKMSLDDFRLVVDVHLMGAAICTKAVWETMRAQRYGRIVMTTSSSGLYGNFGQANYGAAKMALVGLMQTLAIEGEKYGIRVNCLAPTAATQMTRGVLSDESLALLDPAFVSPGLLALTGEEAPTRTILCAGAGHFATAHVTLSQGLYIGTRDTAGAQLVEDWAAVANRAGEVVPAYGFIQAERELASAGGEVGVRATLR